MCLAWDIIPSWTTERFDRSPARPVPPSVLRYTRAARPTLHALKEASLAVLSHSRPAHSSYHRARTRPPARERVALKYPVLLVIATSQVTRPGYLSYLSPTPCLRFINPTRPCPRPLPNPTLAASTPTPIRSSSSSLQHPAHPRPPRHQRAFVSPRPTDTTRRPHGTPLEHSPSVQTSMGL